MKFRVLFLFTFLFVSSLISSCKKDTDLDDPTVYLWKRELYRESLFTENPFQKSPFTDPTFGTIRNYNSRFLVSTEYVRLTHAQAKAEREKKEKDSGRLFSYRHIKVDKEG